MTRLASAVEDYLSDLQRVRASGGATGERSSYAPLADDGNERPGVFLTNALTGWEPHTTKPLPFPELEEERDRAERVKQNTPILVILGNPPYNGFAGMAVDEERALSEAYRVTKRVRRPEGQGLNDLYVRFFRMAERRIRPPGLPALRSPDAQTTGRPAPTKSLTRPSGRYPASPSRRSTRSLSGCTGRELLGKIALNASICSADSATGSVMTIQETPSVQGGVVSEPM